MLTTDEPDEGSRRLSVLFVTAMYPHLEQPGSGAFVMHQVEGLRKLGHQVDVIHVKGHMSRWNYLRGAIAVLRATWRARYDLVHVHYGLTGICALVRWRTPMVVTLHGSDVLQGGVQLLVSRFVSAIASATIVVSPAIRARCAGTLIPCGVDMEEFHPIDRSHARLVLGLDAGRKYVLFPFDPGRLVKRCDIASAAVDLLHERGLDISLLAVWDVPNSNMPLYYAAANAMVLCSDTEGSPTAVKEALACNLPVVSVDVGDVRTITQGVESAEICEQKPACVAAALERAIEKSERTASHGRTAMLRYDQRTTIEAVVRVYTTMLRRHSRSSAGTHGSVPLQTR